MAEHHASVVRDGLAERLRSDNCFGHHDDDCEPCQECHKERREAADALDTLKTLTRYPEPETGHTYNDGYCRGYNAALAVVKSIVEGEKS